MSTIGVLSVQGDVHENIMAARAAAGQLGADVKVSAAKTPQEIGGLDGIIIPGGESTTMGHMSLVNGALKALKERIQGGMPALGICAGMIMLSGATHDRVVGRTDQPLLGVLDVKVERNAFGRQRESFEAPISLGPLGISEFTGVFIRAPSVSEAGPKVEAVSKLGDRIVAVRQGNVIGTAFHPELGGDVSVHKHLVQLATEK